MIELLSFSVSVSTHLLASSTSRYLLETVDCSSFSSSSSSSSSPPPRQPTMPHNGQQREGRESLTLWVVPIFLSVSLHYGCERMLICAF